MGNSIKLECGCGYNKILLIGEGILAISLNHIRRTFTAKELARFEKSIVNDKTNFRLLSVPAHCSKCKDIISISALRYLMDGKKEFIYKPCQECNETAVPISKVSSKNILCPKCSDTLRVTNDDTMWD
jgi:ribosomal protein S27E